MNFNRKIFAFSLAPLIFSCAIFNTSCNKEISFNCHFKDHAIASGWDDPVLDMKLDEFKKTFTYGDILELEIDAKNGQKYVVDLPYVSEFTEAGYYAPCIADYNDDIDKELAVDISLALWPNGKNVTTDQFFGCPVKVKMKEKGGYKDAMGLANCGEKLSYEQTGNSPTSFSNFRDISEVGDINKFINEGTLYRGSAPFMADSTERYDYVNQLMSLNKIQNDVCLSKEIINSKGEYPFFNKIQKDKSPNADYIRELYGTDEANPNHVCAYNFGTDYFTANAIEMVKGVLTYLAKDGENTNSYFIHCNEGKDRTGFFLMLLEAFACPDSNGNCVAVNDIIADFMLSYKNYFNITLADNINRYQQIAELTIYRHIYSIMLDNPAAEIGAVDWFNKDFDVRVEVNKKLKDHTLYYYAEKYIKDVVKLEETSIEGIQKKFYKNYKEVN